MALLAKIFLHENVTLEHWLGIALITAGVGFVATGPSLTVETSSTAPGKLPDAANRSDA
jgi:drug/metabolite transporter (DMT)-like permease